MKKNKTRPTLDIENGIIMKNENCLIAGIDEAGRGPLAGPVVIGIVYFDNDSLKKFHKDKKFSYIAAEINDSKKVSEKKREELAWHIETQATYCNTIIVPPSLIDQVNILNATKYGFKKAIEDAMKVINLTDVLIDGNAGVDDSNHPLAPSSLKREDYNVLSKVKQTLVINGDSKSISIACASILAKTTRDRLMLEHHQKYPVYGFDKHKGYGTRLHYEMLQKHGPCPIHRLSFNLKLSNKDTRTQVTKK